MHCQRLAVAAALAVLACRTTPERPSPGGGDLPYPRIASYQLETSIDESARSTLERVLLAVVDAEAGALEPDTLRDIAARNPRMDLLAYLTSEKIHRDASPTDQPLAVARFSKIPASAWVLEPGSTTVGMTTDSATRIRVAAPASFAVTRPASLFYGEGEPTYLLVGNEHLKLLAIDGDELVVERGFRSTAAMHPAGTPIAAHVVFVAGTWMLDIAGAAWRDLLATEAQALVTAGPWNGIFLDGCFEDIGVLNGGLIDLDRNGVADDPAVASSAWKAGFGGLVDALRERLGDDVPLVANPGAQDCPHDAFDGILLEGFPTGLPPDVAAPFQTGLDRYLRWTRRPDHPALSIVNSYSPKIGAGTIEPGDDEMARADYAAMRFGLAIALMGDGYYTFDNGVFGHDVAWWYDEYDGAGRGMGWLGHPQGPPTRIGGGGYVRTFTKGMVIANPTETPLTFAVPAGYHKLKGTQDPAHNDGSEVTAPIVVNAKDAYLLAR